MSRIAFTVTFADGSSKAYSRNFPEGELMAQLAEFVATRPYVRKPVSIQIAGSKNVHVLKSASKPAPAPVSKPVSKPAPVSTRATKAELLARIAELEAGIAPKAPEAPSAPARKPRITQTRAERKASTSKRKAADDRPANMARHDASMSNPVYANAYNAALDGTDGKSKASHVTATMRAWKALEAETLSKATRKAHKTRKAA